jgi:hypothetical protein
MFYISQLLSKVIQNFNLIIQTDLISFIRNIPNIYSLNKENKTSEFM